MKYNRPALVHQDCLTLFDLSIYKKISDVSICEQFVYSLVFRTFLLYSPLQQSPTRHYGCTNTDLDFRETKPREKTARASRGKREQEVGALFITLNNQEARVAVDSQKFSLSMHHRRRLIMRDPSLRARSRDDAARRACMRVHASV